MDESRFFSIAIPREETISDSLEPPYDPLKIGKYISYFKDRNDIDGLISELPRIADAVAEIDESSKAHQMLAYGLDFVGMMSDALVEYRRAVELDPGSAIAHYFLGDALLKANQIEEARNEWLIAKERWPNEGVEQMKQRGVTDPETLEYVFNTLATSGICAQAQHQLYQHPL